MSKAKNVNKASTDVQIAWFKWEFLRRNEDYQKDDAWFEGRFREWFRENGNWFVTIVESPTPLAKSFFRSEVVPAARMIKQRWGISEPVNPASDFNMKTGNRTKPGTHLILPTFLPPEDQDDRDLRALEPELPPAVKERINSRFAIMERMSLDSTPPKKPEDYRFIELKIDIAQSLESTLQRVESSIH